MGRTTNYTPPIGTSKTPSSTTNICKISATNHQPPEYLMRTLDLAAEDGSRRQDTEKEEKTFLRKRQSVNRKTGNQGRISQKQSAKEILYCIYYCIVSYIVFL